MLARRAPSEMLDAGCWMLDAGCWMLDAGCWMLDKRNLNEGVTVFTFHSLSQNIS
jgi:hypothetical protein